MDRETKVELGIVYTRAPTGYWVRLYTLDDGREITCNELALRLGSSIICARARLNTSTNPKHVFRSVRELVHKGDDYVDTKSWIKSRDWYTDPFVKLMLKSI
jgi:hypothetical protein